MKYRKKVYKMVLVISITCIIFVMVAIIAFKLINCDFKNGLKSNQTSNETQNIEEKYPDDDPSKNSTVKVTYKTEKYETKNDDGKIVCRSERNIPTISNDAYTKGAKIMESNLRTIMNDLWNNDLRRFQDDAKDVGTVENPVGIKYLANLEYQTDEIVTFSLKIEGDFGTGSMAQNELYTFDIKTGTNLSIEMSSSNPEELRNIFLVLAKNAITEKGVNVRVMEGETEDSVILNNMERQGHFGILADGVHLNYQKFELTTDTDETMEVVLEKEKANPLLKDEYKIK